MKSPSVDLPCSEQSYLLLDGALMDALKIAYQYDNSPSVDLLYRATRHQPVLEISPCLIKPSEHSRLWDNQDVWRSNGVVLEADCGMEELADHLRSLLSVCLPDGSVAYLRFYVPSQIQMLLSVFASHETVTFSGPVGSWHYFDEEKGWMSANVAEAGEARTGQEEGWFHLQQNHLDALGHEKHRAFLTRLASSLGLSVSDGQPERVASPAANELITSSCEPAQVVADAPCGDKIVEVVHITGSDELILLTDDELAELEVEEKFVCGPLNEYYRDLDTLAEENQGGDERPRDAEGKVLSPVQQRKDVLVRELFSREVIPQGMQSTPPLTEIKRLAGGSHYTYVRSEKIANHFRRYPMGARDSKRSKGWLSREGVDPEKLREAIESELNIKLNMSWSPDADNPVVLALNQYYDEVSWSIWGDEEAQQENRDRTGFDASAEAQFLRFAAGSSASGEFNPRSGKVHFQGKAEAQYSLLEGKASIEQAFPTNNRSEIRIYYRVGGWDGDRTYTSLGHFQARLAISVTGFAGASALLAANVHVDSTQGFPTLKGIAAREHGQSANLEANVFAGVRGGCEVAGSLLWVDTLATHSDWKPLCQIGKKVEAAAGVGVEGELRLEYNEATGKFYFNLHAGLVFGVGPSGNFLLEVDVENTLEMIHFVYKALGDSDFRYIELFDRETFAFEWYQKISLYALAQGISHAEALSRALETASGAIHQFWRDFTDPADGFFGSQVDAFQKERRGLVLANNVLRDIEKRSESVFYHSPPEVKGAILHALMADFWLTPQLGDGTRTKVRAVAEILASFQAWRDFEESMKRINAEGGAEPQTFHRNVERVFRFIGFNQHRYQLYKRALEFKTADLEQVVRRDPHGACKISGIV